jgi:hypothetical protein
MSTLDWSKLCDTALAVRKRIGKLTAFGAHGSVLLTEGEVTTLVVAALEYSNRLAHEAGRKERKKRE